MRKVLITGSTDGIGKQAALLLAKKRYRVLIHGRSREKIEQTVSFIKLKSGNDQIEGYRADLSSLKELTRMSETIREKEKKLDVILNNAGVIMHSRQESEAGVEMTFAINHLGHFYLTGQLIKILNKEHGRIINLTSKIHSSGLDFDTFPEPAFYDPVEAYSNSKLCNVLFTYHLSKMLGEHGITVNCMHPGVINTKMLIQTWGPVGEAVEAGAAREVFMVDAPDVENSTGKYFVDNRPVQSVPFSYNTSAQEKLWQLSLDLIGKQGFSTFYG